MILGKEYRGEKLGEIDGVSVRATANGHYLVFRIGRGVPATREDILIKDLRVRTRRLCRWCMGSTAGSASSM